MTVRTSFGVHRSIAALCMAISLALLLLVSLPGLAAPQNKEGVVIDDLGASHPVASNKPEQPLEYTDDPTHSEDVHDSSSDDAVPHQHQDNSDGPSQADKQEDIQPWTPLDSKLSITDPNPPDDVTVVAWVLDSREDSSQIVTGTITYISGSIKSTDAKAYQLQAYSGRVRDARTKQILLPLTPFSAPRTLIANDLAVGLQFPLFLPEQLVGRIVELELFVHIADTTGQLYTVPFYSSTHTPIYNPDLPTVSHTFRVLAFLAVVIAAGWAIRRPKISDPSAILSSVPRLVMGLKSKSAEPKQSHPSKPAGHAQEAGKGAALPAAVIRGKATKRSGRKSSHPGRNPFGKHKN